ncbi:hypothetical protein H0H81_004992 [Sphagnurus paluster]|uniref:Xylanolytic transcriptional activator regulatory domain-containing protein n=1 Tax=Sphagnurus paluster TaxID=117069 RepID=A0A9P7GLU4_9AGAR|nr:hypothetical protein H0H81_004992 [Sphagnurus paluster]
MDWRYSDHSEDEVGQDTHTTNRKRSSRGPSYKRGPPKGYIHAIEQRWHQVESLLGAIIQCPDPRVQGIVYDLKQDDLAREILRRVDTGPYGPSGRRNQRDGATKEDFFASILKSSESVVPSRDSTRARRQSRVSREIVSSTQDNGLSVIPTKEWQDNLSNKLATSSKLAPSYDSSRFPRRRRLHVPDPNLPSQPDWNEMYTIEPEEEEVKDATDGIGELSLDENQEVRYHGKASGMHLLGRNVRTDDRIDGGIWRLPMSRVWPASQCRKQSTQDDMLNMPLPSILVQDRLIDLYFNYVHPIFPVLHKKRFLTEYNFRKQNGPNARPMSAEYAPGSPRRDPSQEATPLLLFSIFSITARFCDDEITPPLRGKMWEGGCNYLDSARAILTKVFHESRPSTVQSLLLLGYREFGIGSMEQAWLFIGMAIRMAMDLGMNCNSATWKIHGHDLFSPSEIQTRCQIWWICCMCDRYGSVYMGRPIVIKDDDFDTPLPTIDECIHNAYSDSPSNLQASLGFQQCMAALKDMEIVWPSASRAWELLNGVKMEADNMIPQVHISDRQKRPAEAAFGQEKSSDYLQREAFHTSPREMGTVEGENGVQELGTRIMAHMLGLNIPGIEPSTSYYPGYEWWPRTHEVSPPSLHQLSPEPLEYGSYHNSMAGPSRVTLAGTEWTDIPVPGTAYTYGLDGYEF